MVLHRGDGRIDNSYPGPRKTSGCSDMAPRLRQTSGQPLEQGGIMRELRCRDAGFDCDAVVHGESDDEIFAQAAPHAEQVHGVQVTPEMKQQLAGLIHDA